MPLKGQKLTEEQKKTISLKLMGNKNRLGTFSSVETRLKMSIAKKGRKLSEEHRRNIGLSGIGRHVSKEVREKMRLRFKGIPLSEEHRKKLSIAHIGVQAGKKNYFFGKSFSGPNSARWITDRTKINFEDRRNPESKLWAIRIKKRDGWKCKMSNSDCNGNLVAHHILPWRDYPKLRYIDNNGITLCKFHHPIKRNEEKQLVSTFKELINII